MKKEAKEPAHSKMSKAQLAHEKPESKTHETKEHAAVQRMLKMKRK